MEPHQYRRRPKSCIFDLVKYVLVIFDGMIIVGMVLFSFALLKDVNGVLGGNAVGDNDDTSPILSQSEHHHMSLITFSVGVLLIAANFAFNMMAALREDIKGLVVSGCVIGLLTIFIVVNSNGRSSGFMLIVILSFIYASMLSEERKRTRGLPVSTIAFPAPATGSVYCPTTTPNSGPNATGLPPMAAGYAHLPSYESAQADLEGDKPPPYSEAIKSKPLQTTTTTIPPQPPTSTTTTGSPFNV